jgi:Sybindin-like family
MLQASLPSFTSTPTQEPPAPRNIIAYNIYIFNREGTCLYYHEWSRPKPVQHGAGSEQDDQKMMFGLFFSLKTFTAAMDPRAPEGYGIFWTGCHYHDLFGKDWQFWQ